MDIRSIIANNIKQLRLANGLNQNDVADAIAIDVSVYSRIENGKTMASYDKLHNLSKLFRVPMEKFFEGLGSNIQNNYDNAQVNANVQINFNQSADALLKEMQEMKSLLSALIQKL